MWLVDVAGVVVLLSILVLEVSPSYVLFEDSPRQEKLHPRTFYLTSYQENELITRVFCEGYSCPYFEVVKDYSNYIQHRTYSKATFLVNTDRKSCDLESTVQLALSKFQAYRNGSNERDQTFSETLPLLIQMDVSSARGSNPWCRMNYTVGMYLPHYWGILPAPSQKSLKFTQLKEGLQIYVHTYPGPTQNLLLKELDTFRRNMEKMGLCYTQRRFYVAVYDIPGVSRDIRNEIWMEKCPRYNARANFERS